MDTMEWTKIVGGLCGSLLVFLLIQWGTESIYHGSDHTDHGEHYASQKLDNNSETTELDENSWVYDFGSFKEIRKWVKDNFDHTLLIAKDDPEKDFLMSFDDKKIAKVIELPDVGCEKFAEYTYNFVSEYISSETSGRVKLISVEVFEHGANSAVFKNI